MTIDLINAGLVQGLILSIIALGVMIPFRYLDFPDLTAEGAYPLGGAVSASLLVFGHAQVISILGGMLAGGILAICTAQVAIRLKVNSLLAGIILSTMAYSINLKIMGKPNIALFGQDIIEFDIFLLCIIVAFCGISFAAFLFTDFGLRFRTIGINPEFAKNNNISINKYTSLGLFIAGSLFGLAGSLMVQIQQFMDVGMGVGIIVHGLAGLMIGEAILGNKTIIRQMLSPIIGALIYQQIQGLALSLGLMPTDLKFFTGGIVLIVLALKNKKI